jgi:hypothetical protein
MGKGLVRVAILSAFVGATVLCLISASSTNVSLLSRFSFDDDEFQAQAKKHKSKPTNQEAGSNSTGLANLNVNQSAIPSPKLNNTKVVMIGFDDSYKSQFLYAKPILDRYGFKASFFEVCTWVGKTSARQTWQDVAALQRDGMDIESHTMTHAHLPDLLSSTDRLDYEIGGSKQCLANHGVNATIFGYPLNLGSDNPKIVNVVAKYYDLARSGSAPLMFLDCKGYKKQPQNDCRTYTSDGKLTLVNRYNIKSDSFRHIYPTKNLSPSQEYQIFVERMNSQIPYNTNGKIRAIPIITYHNLTNSIKDYNSLGSTITVGLFAQQMKYLHDNGFRVLLLNQLGFDPANNLFYIKNSQETLIPLK